LNRAASFVVTLGLFAVACMLGADRVSSQEALKGAFPVADLPFDCRDFRGQRVVVMQAPGLGDVARARIIGRIPYIQLDPDRLATLPPPLQHFFFGHECAHHVLAHNFYPTPTVEVDADCWSITTGRDRGLFSRRDVEAFAPYFAHSKGSILGHLPGPERAQKLLSCFDTTSAQAAR
jgi:hypothetical protein